MKKKRPMFLNLTQIHFPIMAIVSILHRISGVILFLSLPILLIIWQHSLLSEQSFADLQLWLHSFWAKCLVGSIIAALGYHTFAGIRHLIMDMGFFESVKRGRRTAVAVFVAEALFVLSVGIWLCM